MSRNKFKTTNELTFSKSDVCPLPGHASFAIGGVAGYFTVKEFSVDFIFIEITIGEHLVDALEYFSELAIQMNIGILRVSACTDENLISLLTDHFQFTKIGGWSLMKILNLK